jgi:hypothetical protein
MYTTGGRGGRVIKVTNLNDSGEGSFRAAVESSGPRIVLFEVSGTITLESQLHIQNDDITIAGQTAPGDGICVRNYKVYVSASNVIIRYMRFRLGDEAQQVDDAMGGNGSRNVIIDHCSMSWSIDECASFYSNEDFTLQWCLITESLGNSLHYGNHGYGGIWGGNRASFHHNLLAHHRNRNPRFAGLKLNYPTDAELVDLRNNVIYNYDGISHGSEGGGCYNMVNNYYKYGPATSDPDQDLLNVLPARAENNSFELEGAHGVFYVHGNYFHGNEILTNDNWKGVKWEEGTTLDRVKSDIEFEKGKIVTDDPETAFQRVLEYVGASIFRDTVDRRTIHDTRTGTASVMDGGNGSTNGYIDTQEAVGGWHELRSLPAPEDTDGDGMPDDWELSHGLDPDDPSDGNGDRDHDLYTNIEEYINALAHDYFDTDPSVNVVQPQKNEIFTAKADTSILVEAYSRDYNGGSVVRMELYLDDVLAAESNDSSEIITILENVPPGMHEISLISTDNSGRVTVDKTTVYVGSRQVEIRVEEAAHGRVELDPPGGLYAEGIELGITAFPEEGYRFHGWIKDIESANRALHITTAKDLVIKPVFIRDPEKKNIWHHPIKINFQPEEDYAVPEGYIPDYGGALREKWTGYSYGWLEGYNPYYGLNLSESGPWKTFRYFENAGTAYSWGMVDEHILDSIPVLDGQLTLSSVSQSRICFIEIDLLELLSSRTLTVENGRGGGEYFPDLEEDITITAAPPPEGQVFDMWRGDTSYLEDVYSPTTFVRMPDRDVSISASYTLAHLDTAYHLIVVNGSGSGLYASGMEVEVSASDTSEGAYFSHWEYGCTKTVSFDDRSRHFSVAMPDANIVFEAVYEVPSSGEGEIYQAEDAHWDEASSVERYHQGYFGLGYVNFREDGGSYVQFDNIDGKEGGKYRIRLRYSLNDPDREGVVLINGVRDTIVMTNTGSWSSWDEIEVDAILEPGSQNTIRIETTGDDLGYLDQITLVKLNTTDLELPRQQSGMMNVSCYPNPFKDYALISFELLEASDVRIELYNLQGLRVRELGQGAYPAGRHELRLGRGDLETGLYILRVAGNGSGSQLKVLVN